jgi:hypothetical protein
MSGGRGALCQQRRGRATDTNADSPSLGVQNAIGRPCDLSVDAGPTPAVYNASASECPSNLCLKPAEQPGAPMGNPLTQATCSPSCA